MKSRPPFRARNLSLGAAACLALLLAASMDAKDTPDIIQPDFLETRAVKLKQTVRLADIDSGSEKVRMWVPIPSDRNWQRVLDVQVESAPGKWEIVAQKDGLGDFLYLEVDHPEQQSLEVVLSCLVERQGVHFPLGDVQSTPTFEKKLFGDSLDTSAPLMFADDRVRQLAAEACGQERDIARQAVMLVHKVAEYADHYSKDPTKPHCGRGSAQDCMVNGGGCCTDLHSLFIAMARSRGIAARMQYGYRLLDDKEGAEFDPGYRCWVEYFIPGAGWVPTDIVAADNADEANPYRWSSLSPYRVWLWEGRSFELTPAAEAGAVDTMLCGWAEIDGKAVNPLPGDDGTPPQMTRTVDFQVLHHARPDGAPKLPE